MECLDDATMYELAGGGLDPEGLAAADAHVDTCPECRAVLAGLLRTVDTGDPDPDPGPAAGLRRGDFLGRYLVLEEIGGGAMGVVYAAYDPDLHRKVALKLLRATGEEAGERMLREAQAMARLQHPNVVAIYEVGRSDDDIFIAMELVEGQTLTRWLREHRRKDGPTRERVRLFAQAGEGLAAAHRAGLVHRDFKPDNVIVDDAGRVRVTDFGLAHGRDAAPQPDVDLAESSGQATAALGRTLTRTGTLLGTPAYMAPEQLEGRVTDARSDQFSFCVALFEAITGERPFGGSTVAELRAAVVAGKIDAQMLDRAPRWLRAALARGLSVDPAARWESMDVLVAELSRDRDKRRWLWPSLAAAALAGALLIAMLSARGSDRAAQVCTGAGAELGRVWNSDRKREIRAAFAATKSSYAERAVAAVIADLDRWGAAWMAAHRDTCRATRVQKRQSEALLDIRMACMRRRLGELDALAGELTSADQQTVIAAANAASALGSIDECADTTALQTVVRPRDPAQARAVDALRRELAKTSAMTAAGKYRQAAAAAAAQIGRAAKIGHAPLIAEARLIEAWIAIKQGRADDAERAAYEALWAAQKGRDDAGAARAWLTLLDNAGAGGRYDRAARLGNHARAAIERIGSPPRLVARMRSALGLIAYNRGDYDEASRQLSRGLELTRRHLGAEHVDVPRALTNLGNVARARGDYPKALERHRAAMALDRKLRGKDHPVMGRHLHNVAGVLRLQGKLRPALERYREALAIKRAALGDEHHEVALTHNSIGIVHFDLGELAAAQTSFERSLAIFSRAGHGERGLALHNLGLTHAARGEHQQALQRLTAALDAYEKVHGSRHERVARVTLALARSELALGHRKRARAWIARALAVTADRPAMAHVAKEARKLAAAGRPDRRPRPLAPAPPKSAAEQPPPPRPRPKPSIGPVYGPSQGWD